ERLLYANKPIAIVVAGTSDMAPAIAQLAQLVPTETITLPALEVDDIRQLVQVLLPALAINAELVDTLHERSAGNPSKLRELVRALETPLTNARTPLARAVSPAAHDEPARPAQRTSELPLRRAPSSTESTLHPSEVLQVRLAALSSFERLVLQWASVIGELFWDGALLALARAEASHAPNDAGPAPAIDPILRWTQAPDEAHIAAALLALEQNGFIVKLADTSPAGLREYTFAAATTRGLIYDAFPDPLRKRRHGVVATWLGLASHAPADGLHAALGKHHERAGQRAPAAQAYLAAARVERLRLRTTHAVRYAQKAVALADTSDARTRMHALLEVGSLLTTLNDYEPAATALNELVEQAWQIGARAIGGAALHRLARIHSQRGEHGSALEYLNRALLLLHAAEDPSGLAAAYDDIAHVQRARGEGDAAITAAQRSLHESRAQRDLSAEATALTTLGFIELDRGNLAAARSQFEAAQITRSTPDNDPEGAIHTEIGLGKLAHYEGQFARANKRYAVALDRARALSDRRLQCALLIDLAEVQLAQGLTETALEWLVKARALAAELRDQRASTAIQQHLALIALARNEPTAAQQLAMALQTAREHGTSEAIASAHRGLAHMHARVSYESGPEQSDAAEASFREAIRVYQESGNFREAACTRAELGFYLVERGPGARARAALGEAYAALKPLSLPALERVTATLEELGL
ncbi:MAG: hypothetical protein RL701_8121, partial [Pseudomonadota bacterium]